MAWRQQVEPLKQLILYDKQEGAKKYLPEINEEFCTVVAFVAAMPFIPIVVGGCVGIAIPAVVVGSATATVVTGRGVVTAGVVMGRVVKIGGVVGNGTPFCPETRADVTTNESTR